MVEQDTIGWICSFIVISLLIITVIYEVVKRWRLSLRLVALDESLLNDNSCNPDTDCAELAYAEFRSSGT